MDSPFRFRLAWPQIRHHNVEKINEGLLDLITNCRMDGGSWTPDSRKQYNLVDAVVRSTIQVRIKIYEQTKINSIQKSLFFLHGTLN